MRFFAALSFATFSLALGSIASAQPSNDRIQNAIELSAETRINRVEGKIIGATIDTDVRYTIDDDDIITYFPWPIVWYKWDAPISGKVVSQLNGIGFYMWGITVQGTPGDALFDLTGYAGTSRTYGDSGTSISSYSYDVEGGKTYYVGVMRGPSLSSSVNVDFDFKFVQLFTADPISDDFATRTPIGGKKFTITANLSSFDEEEGEPEHSTTAVTPARRTGWMTITPKTRSSITLKAESATFEPLIAVYRGDALATLTRVAQSTLGSGSSRNFTAATLSFVAEAGVPYSIAVDGNRAKAGAFTLNVQSTTVKPGFLVRPRSVIAFQGEPVAFTATAATTGDASYQWQRYNPSTKKWEAVIDDDVVFAGATTDTLTIYATDLEMNGDKFRIVVTDDVGSTSSPAASLTVTEFIPFETERLGSGQIDLSLGVLGPIGGVYQAKGLPKGFSIDEATGIISGDTITAKAGTYRVTYWTVLNNVKSEVYSLQLVIKPYSTAFVGKFEALLQNDTQIPVAKLELTVNTSGVYTGKIFSFSDSKSHAYRGQLSLDQEARVSDGSALLNKGTQSIEISIAESTRVLSATLSQLPVGEDGSPVTLASTTSGVALGAFTRTAPADWANNYTVLLKDVQTTTPSENPIPAGDGFATAKITGSSGNLALTGRTADGAPFTANLRSSATASYRIGQKIYAGTGGYITGWINLSERGGTLLTFNSPEFGESAVYVNKPARDKEKAYPLGFSNLSYRFWMEPWMPIPGNAPASLGLSETGEIAINLNGPGITNEPENIRGLPRNFVISAKGKVVSVDSNTSKFAFTFNTQKGSFTGSFLVFDQPESAPKPIPRKVTFSGVMLQQSFIFEGAPIGGGHMSVPPIPQSGESTVSAEFEVLAGPPALPF